MAKALSGPSTSWYPRIRPKGWLVSQPHVAQKVALWVNHAIGMVAALDQRHQLLCHNLQLRSFKGLFNSIRRRASRMAASSLLRPSGLVTSGLVVAHERQSSRGTVARCRSTATGDGSPPNFSATELRCKQGPREARSIHHPRTPAQAGFQKGGWAHSHVKSPKVTSRLACRVHKLSPSSSSPRKERENSKARLRCQLNNVGSGTAQAAKR